MKIVATKNIHKLLGLSVAALLLVFAYRLGTLSVTNKTTVTTNTSSQTEVSEGGKFLTRDELLNTSGIIYEGISEQESGPYISILRKFESYHKENDAKGILTLFSFPANDNEKGTLAFLEGIDINMESPISRLFSTNELSHKLNWYLIKSVKRLGSNVSIKLLENRTAYIPTGTPEENPDLYFSNQEYLILEIDKDLKIEKFHYPLVESGSTGKYDGFFNSSY